MHIDPSEWALMAQMLREFQRCAEMNLDTNITFRVHAIAEQAKLCEYRAQTGRVVHADTTDS